MGASPLGVGRRFRPLVTYAKAWWAGDPKPDRLTVEATPAAVAFIQEGGGRLFVWADEHGLVHTKLNAPDVPVDFERLWCDSFEFNIDTSIETMRQIDGALDRLDLDALAEAQARQDAVAAQRLILDLLLTR